MCPSILGTEQYWCAWHPTNRPQDHWSWWHTYCLVSIFSVVVWARISSGDYIPCHMEWWCMWFEVAMAADTGTQFTVFLASQCLGWEIHSEFHGIPQLIWFRTFWTPEFSSEFHFSDCKMCSRQFWAVLFSVKNLLLPTTSQRTSTAFLAGKKHQVFFPATTEQYIALVNLFRKPSVSFYLMAIDAIVAIHWECIIPVALFNWSVITY